MHARTPEPRGPRLSSGRPLDVAASLALTIGLIGCAAPVAQAVEAPSATAGVVSTPAATSQLVPSPSPSPAPAAEHPSLTRSISARFIPIPGFAVNQRVVVEFTFHLRNTGDVPLGVFINGNIPLAEDPFLAPGESKSFTDRAVYTAEYLQDGHWTERFEGEARTPRGAVIDADVYAWIPLPPAPAPPPRP